MAFDLQDLTSSYDLSADGVCMIGTVKLGGFKSGTLTFAADTIDNSTRDDQGWGASTAGNRTATLEVTYNKISDDECQKGIRSYALASDFQTQGVQIVYRSESGNTSTGSGFKGIFVLTNLSETQDKDGTAVEETATFASFGAITADNAT